MEEPVSVVRVFCGYVDFWRLQLPQHGFSLLCRNMSGIYNGGAESFPAGKRGYGMTPSLQRFSACKRTQP